MDPSFRPTRASPLTRTDVNRRIRLWAKRTGINGDREKPDLTTHGLRWSFTTILVKRDCAEGAIARLRGDSREKSMVTYHTGDDEKELREIYLK